MCIRDRVKVSRAAVCFLGTDPVLSAVAMFAIVSSLYRLCCLLTKTRRQFLHSRRYKELAARVFFTHGVPVSYTHLDVYKRQEAHYMAYSEHDSPRCCYVPSSSSLTRIVACGACRCRHSYGRIVY